MDVRVFLFCHSLFFTQTTLTFLPFYHFAEQTTPAVSLPAVCGFENRNPMRTLKNATGGPDFPPPLPVLVSSFPCLQLPRHDALRGFRCNNRPSSRFFPGTELFYTTGGSRRRSNVRWRRGKWSQRHWRSAIRFRSTGLHLLSTIHHSSYGSVDVSLSLVSNTIILRLTGSAPL